MQDPMEQIYYMIAIGKYFIVQKKQRCALLKPF